MMRKVLVAVVLAAMLSACSGSHGVTPAPRRADAGLAKLMFAFPAEGSTARSRGPKYVSRATAGIGISYGASGAAFPDPKTPMLAFDVSESSSLCTVSVTPARTCTLTVPALVGTDDFQITAWDAVPSGGAFSGGQERLTSVTVLNQLVLRDQDNAIPFTMDGVVDSIFLSVSPAILKSGTPAVATLSVIAKDVDGNIIIAPGNFIDAAGNPLTINVGTTTTGGSGNVTLTTSAFTGTATTTTTVNYDGGTLTSASFTASPTSAINGANVGATLTFMPATGT